MAHTTNARSCTTHCNCYYFSFRLVIVAGFNARNLCASIWRKIINIRLYMSTCMFDSTNIVRENHEWLVDFIRIYVFSTLQYAIIYEWTDQRDLEISKMEHACEIQYLYFGILLQRQRQPACLWKLKITCKQKQNT